MRYCRAEAAATHEAMTELPVQRRLPRAQYETETHARKQGRPTRSKKLLACASRNCHLLAEVGLETGGHDEQKEDDAAAV